MKRTSTTGAILAGGGNRRIGVKKGLLRVGGRRIISRIHEIYTEIFKEMVIVTNTPEEYEFLGVEMLPDIYPGKGAMGGIYTALSRSRSGRVFVTACDMPFISEEAIREIIKETGYDVVVPLCDGRLHPLHALYAKSCLPVMQQAVLEGRLRIQDIFNDLRVKTVHLDEEHQGHSFFNVNTWEEYERAVVSLRQ